MDFVALALVFDPFCTAKLVQLGQLIFSSDILLYHIQLICRYIIAYHFRHILYADNLLSSPSIVSFSMPTYCPIPWFSCTTKSPNLKSVNTFISLPFFFGASLFWSCKYFSVTDYSILNGRKFKAAVYSARHYNNMSFLKLNIQAAFYT